VVFLVLVYLGNLLGPPPPNTRSVALLGLSGWLLIVWAYWIDRHRQVVVPRFEGEYSPESQT